MGLFVEIAQRHAVCEKLVQLLGHLQTDRLLQFERDHLSDATIFLDLRRTLVQPGLGCDSGTLFLESVVGHVLSPLDERLESRRGAADAWHQRLGLITTPINTFAAT